MPHILLKFIVNQSVKNSFVLRSTARCAILFHCMGAQSLHVRSRVTCLLRDARGVTAIEFALVAPVLLLMLFAVIEFSLIMLTNNLMESATATSSRLGKTGFSASGQTREETILQSIADRAGSFINTNNLTITTRVYDQFDQIGDAEPWIDNNANLMPDPGEFVDVNGNGIYDTDMARVGYGDAEDIVVYTITYPWPIQTPIMRELVGDTNGNFTITTSAVVKNEPYDN